MAPKKKQITSTKDAKGINDGKKLEPKFTPDELSVLANDMTIYYQKLFGTFDGYETTHQEKESIWGIITDNVNAVGNCKRDVAKVKRKWQDWKSRTKLKIAAIRKSQRTSSGKNDTPAGTLTDDEDKIRMLLGETAISGVPGGIDSEDFGNETQHEDDEQDGCNEAEHAENMNETDDDIMHDVQHYEMSHVSGVNRDVMSHVSAVKPAVMSHVSGVKRDVMSHVSAVKPDVMSHALGVPRHEVPHVSLLKHNEVNQAFGVQREVPLVSGVQHNEVPHVLGTPNDEVSDVLGVQPDEVTHVSGAQCDDMSNAERSPMVPVSRMRKRKKSAAGESTSYDADGTEKKLIEIEQDKLKALKRIAASVEGIHKIMLLNSSNNNARPASTITRPPVDFMIPSHVGSTMGEENGQGCFSNSSDSHLTGLKNIDFLNM